VGEDDVQDAGRDAGVTVVTVAEAAQHLGITKEAVRKRISRGTLRSDKDTDGTVRVYIPASSTAEAGYQPISANDALISARDETIAALRDQLEAERQANSEHRRLLAAALERIPQAIEAAETVEEAPEGSGSHPGTDEPQEGVLPPQERSWWRRMFGG